MKVAQVQGVMPPLPKGNADLFVKGGKYLKPFKTGNPVSVTGPEFFFIEEANYPNACLDTSRGVKVYGKI